jgi:hypothetical protein
MQLAWSAVEIALYRITTELPRLALGIVGTLFAVATVVVAPLIVAAPDRAKEMIGKAGAILAVFGGIIVAIAFFASTLHPGVLLALVLSASLGAYFMRERRPNYPQARRHTSERKPTIPKSWGDV